MDEYLCWLLQLPIFHAVLNLFKCRVFICYWVLTWRFGRHIKGGQVGIFTLSLLILTFISEYETDITFSLDLSFDYLQQCNRISISTMPLQRPHTALPWQSQLFVLQEFSWFGMLILFLQIR